MTKKSVATVVLLSHCDWCYCCGGHRCRLARLTNLNCCCLCRVVVVANVEEAVAEPPYTL